MILFHQDSRLLRQCQLHKSLGNQALPKVLDYCSNAAFSFYSVKNSIEYFLIAAFQISLEMLVKAIAQKKKAA